MRFALPRIFAFAALCILFVSCKKDKVDPLYVEFNWKESTNGTVSFTAASTSNNSAIEDDYLWEFGDGAIKQGNQKDVSHTYKTNGSYNVSVTVTAKDGRSKKNTNTIEVKSIR